MDSPRPLFSAFLIGKHGEFDVQDILERGFQDMGLSVFRALGFSSGSPEAGNALPMSPNTG